jgi:2-polyprenyl-3-methyl-5-hydroxy-6-metoxy-1,4-benzoquinol methylase
MDIDTGSYNRDPAKYKALVEELYQQYPPITLPAEYAMFVQDNLARFLIRLARYKFVAKMCRKTDEVLEVGCGSGLGSLFLGQHCRRVVGLDVKGTELQEAKSINRRANVEFREGDVLSDADPTQYDVVVALDVIEHLSEQDGFRFIESLRSRVRPAGMVILGTPSIYSFPYQSPLSQASHVKCYDQQELISQVDRCFHRVLAFSMNDEVVHTGFSKLAWYYFILAFVPKARAQ